MGLIIHLFLPHSSNNHRPKVLHNDSLIILILILLISSFLIPLVKQQAPAILGLSTNITVSQLVELTNKERLKKSLPLLALDDQLSKAAQEKAEQMFTQNYWAHSSPDGKTPWSFILSSGYEYTYAGENLARDFDSTNGVVTAWMNSPGHRTNILSPNYQDIGFAVVNGKLAGQETTLVVQLFGARKGGSLVALPPPQEKPKPESRVLAINENPLINSRFLTRNIAVGVLGFLIIIFVVDMIVAYRRKLVRLVGHNLDHIIFLGSLISIIIAKKGGIL